MFSCFLCCVHSTNIVGRIGSNYGRYEEMEWVGNWIKQWHMEWCVRAAYHIHLPKLKFQNDDKYLNGSSYRLCAANNHSKSIMTVIKTAHKHQFHHMSERSCVCVCLSVLPEPVKNNNKTNAFRLMKRVHICDASTLYLWIRFCLLVLLSDECVPSSTNTQFPWFWIFFSVHSLIFSVNSVSAFR